MESPKEYMEIVGAPCQISRTGLKLFITGIVMRRLPYTLFGPTLAPKVAVFLGDLERFKAT